jgi:DNA-binding LytR/AlgR family response regulator
MNIIIIEDEAVGARRLRRLLLDIDPQITILAELDSVADARDWFAEHHATTIDLIFSDIQLSDGLAFEVLEHVAEDIPVVFTTAYNEYAIRAFKVNGIDYLLKPVEADELRAALQRWQRRESAFPA